MQPPNFVQLAVDGQVNAGTLSPLRGGCHVAQRSPGNRHLASMSHSRRLPGMFAPVAAWVTGKPLLIIGLAPGNRISC